jgi:asparagine synthase (glutamine-hydrolysing)
VIARLFEPAGVTRLLDEHRDGRCNHTRELRALTALALWHRDAFA